MRRQLLALFTFAFSLTLAFIARAESEAISTAGADAPVALEALADDGLLLGVYGKANILLGPCPYGSSYADGCAGANQNGNFKVINAYGVSLSTYATSATYIGAGQTWSSSHQQPWNVAGVDYPVGYDTTLTLKDPSAQQPSGCSYLATGGSNNGPRMVCNTSATSPDVEGYDFSLHNGISLFIGNLPTGSVTIKNNKFVNGSAINGAAGYFISIATNSVYTSLVIQNNLFDGGDEPLSTSCGGLRCTADQFHAIAISNSGGNRTIAYNVFLYTTGRPITSSNFGAYTAAREFNYVEGYQGQDAVNDHGEFYEETGPTASTIPEEDDLYNTIVVSKNSVSNQGTAPLYLSTGAYISSNAPGYVSFTGTCSGTTLTVSAGTPPAIGNYVTGSGIPQPSYVVSGTGPFTMSQSCTASGASLNGGPPTTFTLWNVIGNTLIGNVDPVKYAYQGNLYQLGPISGSITGTTLTITGGPNNLANGAALTGGAGAGILANTYVTGGGGTNTITLSKSNSIGASSNIYSAIMTQSALVNPAYNVFTTLNVTLNYLDNTGVLLNTCFISSLASITTTNWGSGGPAHLGGTQNFLMGSLTGGAPHTITGTWAGGNCSGQ